jgi:hypothetical protein
MKPVIFAVCLLLLASAFVRSAFGQGCGVVMTRNYAAYNNISFDATHIYTQVLVDGSASCTPTPSCPCNTATHTPKAYNQIGSTGGWQSGSPTCVNCYISFQNNQSSLATPGVDQQFNGGGEIVCSIAGVFFSSFFGHKLGIRESAYLNGGIEGTRCLWIPTCTGKCTVNGWTSNANSKGQCYSGTNAYLQCYDGTVDGNCFTYRAICNSQALPGICN